jgi:2-keto-3-deoxy-6-phosphogluconate aldolase
LNIRDIVSLAPVIGEITVTEPALAVPRPRALAAGGMRALEINLQTPTAITCIDAIRKALPEALGGISRQSAPDFPALPNVLCVGASWLAPASVLDAADWSGIEALARDAVSL